MTVLINYCYIKAQSWNRLELTSGLTITSYLCSGWEIKWCRFSRVGKQEYNKKAWDINTADISTSQSDDSKFASWSTGTWLLVQAASAASEYGGRRRGRPGWTSQTKSLNSSLDFKASQTNQVWQDWNSSRVIAGQRIRTWAKSKGTGRKGCSRAMRWKCWGIDGILTDRSTSRWQRFWSTCTKLLCFTWHADLRTCQS